VLSRNRIKYLSSLKIKKYRNQYRQFIMEGDKIVKDILKEGENEISQLIASHEWLSTNKVNQTGSIGEIIEAELQDIARISSLESPSGVLAVLDIPETVPDYGEISSCLSIALDSIQDPGNLGTIIRTADWFGIHHIFCSEDCVDCYNPKVVQASMGALLHVKIYYAGLAEVIRVISVDPDYTIYGTFTAGIPVRDLRPVKKGMIVFGNESRGISDDLFPFISTRITIPPGNANHAHVESLNVASAVSVVCSMVTRS
jgi:RNA methyltransferase, TrmH family